MRFLQNLRHHRRGAPCASAALVLCTLLIALLLVTTTLEAQVLTGVVRLRESERSVNRARLVAQDRIGRIIAEAVTDETGHFQLSLAGKIGVPFRVTVSRLGMKPSLSDEITLADGDTLSATFWVQDLPAEIEEVRTRAVASLNSERYNTAKRRGWRVVEPVDVQARAASSLGLNELMRSLGLPSVIVPNRDGECLRSSRQGRCLPIIMDGVLIGTEVHLNPRDIYFMAVVSASQARAEWGDRAAFGAVAIYTRMHGDVIKPE